MLETSIGSGQAELLRRDEAAAMLNMSPRQLDQLTKEGKLPSPLRLDRIPRWSRAGLIRHIEALSGTPTG